MPETHERQREKSDSLYRAGSARGTYTLPNFASDTSLLDIRTHRLPSFNRDSSGGRGDNERNEQIKDVLSHAQQQTLQNDSQVFSKLNFNESGDTEDALSASRIADKDFPSREGSDREEGINRLDYTVSFERELSLPNQKKLFVQDEDNSRTLHQKFPLKHVHVDANPSILGQEASCTVYDTVQSMTDNMQMKGINVRGRGSLGSELREVDPYNFETSARGTSTNKAKVDPLTAEISIVRGQKRLDRKDERSILVCNAPLIFPQESNMALSKQTISKKDQESSRFPRTTPCANDIEAIITREAEKIKQAGLIDSFKGHQSDSSLSDANDRHFQILVQTHPDGGWGWVVCFGAFLVQFIALGMQNTAGIVYTELVKELKTPRGATAWVGSLSTGIMFFLGPLTTSMCERLGCRIVTICGGFICIAGLLLSSLVTSLYPLYLTYGLMFGTGTSLCYFPTIIVLSKYFKRRIAVVNGLVTAGSGVGTLVIGPVAQVLFLRFGVPNTFRIVAGIFTLVVLCGATFRPVPTTYLQKNRNSEGEGKRKLFDWSIFKNKGYVIWITSLATFQLVYFVPFVHLVRHAEDLGVSPTDASFLIGYLSVASTAGRLFFGKMADLSCVNRVHMYQMGLSMIGLCSFFVTMATGYGGLVAYTVIFGFFEACYILLIPLVTSDIVGPLKMSYALGSAFTFMAFPMFLGPPIAGWMYDISGDYSGAFYSCGGISFLAASLTFLIPRLSTQSNKEISSKRLGKFLHRRRSNHRSEVMHVLFRCLWQEKQESKTSSYVQYSGIQATTKRVDNV